MSRSEPDRESLAAWLKNFGRPGDPDYHNRLGLVKRLDGDLDSAVREFREAVRLQPDDVVFRCNLASALAGLGQPEAARREYDAALRLAPNDYHTLYNYGNLLGELGEGQAAATAYEAAVQADPTRAEARYNLANRYWEQDRIEAAVAQHEQALAIAPDAPAAGQAHMRLGLYYLQRRDWRTSEAHLLQSLRRDGDNFMPHYGLALVYLNMDAPPDSQAVVCAKALLHAQKAVALDPGDEDAQAVAAAAREAFERAKPPE